jgi:hypothetical protein
LSDIPLDHIAAECRPFYKGNVTRANVLGELSFFS